jgi:cytochrome P450
MFNVDYQTMQSSTSEGRCLVSEYDILLKEFCLKQVFNPFRKYLFWNKEVRRGIAAAIRIEKSQQTILDAYRARKSSEEIEKDNSILGHLVRSPYVSDRERCADMTMFMVAGHDTTSHTLAWIILALTNHPEALSKLKLELDSVVKNEHITQSELSDMLYLDYVIKEGMRLWPVAALGTVRVASKDIRHGEYIIPKGSLLQFPSYAIFRCGIKVRKALKCSLDLLRFHVMILFSMIETCVCCQFYAVYCGAICLFYVSSAH